MSANSETHDRFTPASLAELEAPPVFLMRAVPRGRALWDYEVRAAGLRYHSPVATRAEMLDALGQLWSGEAHAQGTALLADFWRRIDAGEEVAAEDRAQLEDLSVRLVEAWPRFASMLADNARYASESHKIAASIIVGGWEGIPIHYRREDGRVPLDLLDDLEAWLATAAPLLGPIAFGQLTSEALKMIAPAAPHLTLVTTPASGASSLGDLT